MVCNNLRKVKNQLLATVVANLVAFAQGCNIGWLAPALPLLMSDASPLLDGVVSFDMAGWIGSFLALGAVTGALIFGLMSNYIGYKNSILLSCIPITVSWLFIIFGSTSLHICCSRYFSGITGGAAFACIPQFVAEIASDFVRGELNSFIQINCYGGILCGYIAGAYLPYDVNPLVMITIPILFLCSFIFVPNSPQYLLRIDKADQAEQSLRFYRSCRKGNKDDEDVVRKEFEKFKAIAKQNELAEPLRFSEFVTPTALRALMISPFLMAVNQFSGSFAICNYAVTIFSLTGSSVDPNVSSIVMAMIQVCGTYSASLLMDKAGRKVLLLTSTAGGCMALLVTGTFAYLATHGYDVSAFSLLPVVSISFFLYISAIGILPVPYVMVSEVLPPRIRRVGATICTCSIFICQFIMLKIFPLLLAALSLYGCMFMFACVSLTGFVFTIFVVRETKGLNLDVLEVNENH